MKTVAAAIEFGTSKITTLIAENSGYNRCDIIGSGTVPYAGYTGGVWNEPERLREAVEASIHAAEVEARRSVKEIYVGVPCENIHVCTAIGQADVAGEDHRITDEDLDRVMDDAADQLHLDQMGGNVLHRSPAWFSVDGGKHTMRLINTSGRTVTALVSFIVADPDFIDDVRLLLGQLGVTVNAFMSPTLGTATLLMSYEERDRTPVLIDVGYLNTEVSVIEGDAITYHAVLPEGGGDITAALAETLEIDMKEAEALKRDYIFKPDEFDAPGDPQVRFADGSVVTFPYDFVASTVELVTDQLVQDIELTLRDAGECVSPKSQIYLTGGGLINMRGVREYLADKLGRGVKIPTLRAARLNNHRFASCLGLMDQVFDAVEQQTALDEEKGASRLEGLKNMFRKRTNE